MTEESRKIPYESGNIYLANPLKVKGYLHIGKGLTIAYYDKLPGRFHRFMQHLLLGFRWEVCE